MDQAPPLASDPTQQSYVTPANATYSTFYGDFVAQGNDVISVTGYNVPAYTSVTDVDVELVQTINVAKRERFEARSRRAALCPKKMTACPAMGSLIESSQLTLSCEYESSVWMMEPSYTSRLM